MQSRRAALAVGLPLLLILVLLAVQQHGPSPKPASAPAGEFSAVRALTFFNSTIHGTIPHPIGSAANRTVRDRIVARFDELGYETRVHRLFACNASGICGWTDNIIARPPGQSSGPSVVVAAHYDSVPAAPGASDDGSGVAAILEIARAVRAERFANPIAFLVDDGEEAGLLGAEAFVAEPAARSASAIVNLEARGTSGPSYLFETSNNNRWLIPIVTRALPHPATSSLFYTTYQFVPNDTDLTVFKRAGMTGVNFAFINDVVNYHTPNDDARHLDLRSLQDHGDNGLAALRAIAGSDLRQRSRGDAVWFDVAGLFIVCWPARWTFFFALVSLGTAIVATALLIRDGESSLSEVAAGAGAFVLSVVAAGVGGFAISKIVALRAVQPWAPHPMPAIVATWLFGLAAAIGVFAFLSRGRRCPGVFAGVAIVWNILAIVMAATLPGASYLFLCPAVALTLFSLLRGIEIIENDTLDAALSAAIAGVVWFPPAAVLYELLGNPVLPVVAIAIAIAASTFAAVFAKAARVAGAGAAVALVLAIVASLLPAATDVHPRRLSLTYLDDGVSTRWIAPALPPRVQHAAAFTKTNGTVYPWSAARSFTAPAPATPLQPVEVKGVSDSGTAKRVLTLHVESPRRALRVNLLFRTAATVDAIRINGITPPPPTRVGRRLPPGWHIAAVRGGSSFDVEITMRGRSRVDAFATDATSGLPAAGAALVAARNASNAVASDDGDTVVTMRQAAF